MFVCFKGRIKPLPDESNLYLQSSLRVLMRQKAIEMVCVHVPQGREHLHTVGVY